jgi:hypothetical protein
MIGRDLDFDLHNATQELLEENASAHSVARLVIHDGYDSLTPAQQALFDAVVTPALRKRSDGSEASNLEWRLPDWAHVGSRPRPLPGGWRHAVSVARQVETAARLCRCHGCWRTEGFARVRKGGS